MDGQSPGKRALGIRVVRDDGRPIRATDALLRNLTRLFEMAAGLYTLTFASLLLSPRRKRLGDYAAGTMVIRDNRGVAPLHFALDIAHLPISEHMRQRAISRVSDVTQAEYEFIDQLFARSKDLSYQFIARLAVELSWRLMRRMGVQPTAEEALSPNTHFFFLQAVAVAYSQRSAQV